MTSSPPLTNKSSPERPTPAPNSSALDSSPNLTQQKPHSAPALPGSELIASRSALSPASVSDQR